MTGFLVRSAATNWAKGSVLAVDAGSHLASITRLLQPYFPLVSEARLRKRKSSHLNNSVTDCVTDTASETSTSSTSPSPEPESTTVLDSGPFAGLSFPHESARANALWIVRECVSTYLITHPHLDHLAGFAINTAAFHNTTRPKKLAALPSTVNAIKAHIFNDIIWPNLTDEDGGVGFVTFQRLASGGNIAVGEGYGKGYMEVCDGVCVKGLKISHGHCTRGPDAMPKRGSDVGLSDAMPKRSGSADARDQRKGSISQMSNSGAEQPGTQADSGGYKEVVVDSTAYFIRDDQTGREVLFFGDVEPDSISLNPRTAQVWTEAAPKVVHGDLRAILIECSYDDSQADNILFGHLAPRHLFRELQVLGEMVRLKKSDDAQKRAGRKRKHGKASDTDMSYPPTDDEEQIKPRRKVSKANLQSPLAAAAMARVQPDEFEGLSPRSYPTSAPVVEEEATGPLTGLTILVIHVKDTLKDGPLPGDKILKQLKQHEAAMKESDGHGLGCEFVISEAGGSYWF